MTNTQIIFNNSIELMKAGIIGTTGRVLILEKPDGTKETINEPEQIHTFAAWKAAGYSVKKGEHAVAAFPVWKYKTGKKDPEKDEENAEEGGSCYLYKAFFFTAAQVEKIAM